MTENVPADASMLAAATEETSWLEKLKRAWNIQLIRVQKISAPVTIVLLILNVSLTLAPQVAWRGWDPRVVAGVTFGVVLVGVLVAANVYILGLDMHQEERRALIQHNPYQVYAAFPWEEITWRWVHLPAYRTLADVVEENGGDASELQDAIDRWERVLDQGYIPRDEYPEHLQDFYVARKEGRP